MRRVKNYEARWMLWRWFDICDPETGALYLRRLYVLRTPLGQVLLHWILAPDWGRDSHDHPFAFVSLVLRGGYAELALVGGEDVRREVRWLNWKCAHQAHRIVEARQGTITLVLTTRRTKSWGFLERSGAGHAWVYWKTYLARFTGGSALPLATPEETSHAAG